MQIPTLDSQLSLRPAPETQRRQLPNALGPAVAEVGTVVGGVFDKIRKDEQLKADQATLMDTEREADSFYNGMLTQAQSTQLKDAQGVTDKSLADFDKYTSDSLNRITSPRIKNAVRQSFDQKRSQLQRQIGGHEADQSRAWQAKSNDDYLSQQHLNAVTSYRDPEAIKSAIANTRSAVNLIPGLDDETRATEFGVRSSGTYAGVVQRYLANDDIKGAEDFYKSVRDGVNGDKATYIENAINDAKRAAEARANANQAEARAALRDQVSDALTRRSYGLTAALPSQAQFVAVYGKDGAQQYKAASQMMQAHDLAAEVAMLPPAQAAERLNQLRPQESDGPGAADKARAYEMGVQIAVQQRKALENDPAGVILANDPKLQMLAQLLADNPGDQVAATSYFRAMTAKQQVLGVEKPKLLPDAQANAIASALSFNPEKPQARAQAYQQLSAAYGKYMPQVLQQVAPALDGHSRVVVNMDPTVAARLDSALVNKKDIEATTAAAVKDIRDELDSGLADFANSLGDQPDAGARVAEHREAAELLARTYALKGAGASSAARQALQEVLGRYQYVGQGDSPSLRVPVQVGRVPVDTDDVRYGSLRQKQQISSSTEFLVIPSRGSTPEQAQRDMAAAVRRFGYWIPNEDESGVVLKIPHAGGAGEVYRKDGSRIELSWAELLAKPAAEPVPYAMRGVME